MDPSTSERSPELVAALERLRALRWCEPDTEMEQQGDAALRWLDERADDLRALSRLGADAPPLPVRVVRSLRVLTKHFRAGLTATGHPGSHTERYVAAARRVAAARTPASVRLAFDVPALVVSSRRSPFWSEAFPSLLPPVVTDPLDFTGLFPATSFSVGDLCDATPGVGPCQLHAEWTALFAGEPSPWEPLVAILERGAWPVLLANELLVWVPVRRDGALEDPLPVEPVRPWAPPVEAPTDWLRADDATALHINTKPERAALERYIAAGLAIPPRTFRIGPPVSRAPGTQLYDGVPTVCLSVAVRPRGPRVGPPVETATGAVGRFWRWLRGDKPEGD